MMIKNLENKLRQLKRLGIQGVKQSLEDEGSSFQEITVMRDLTKKLGLKLNIKIGGCEAKNDIFFCKKISSDSIVAPMVESEYAVKKFIQCAKIDKNNKLLVNLETNNALKNIYKIVKSKPFQYLDGVVIGRSDIAGSLGLSKSEVNSIKIFKKVKQAFSELKKKSKRKLIFKMGGSITPKSKDFIQKLHQFGLVHFIETRNIEIKVSKKNINNLKELIEKSFEFETLWLKFKLKLNNSAKSLKYREDKKRVREIENRLSKK